MGVRARGSGMIPVHGRSLHHDDSRQPRRDGGGEWLHGKPGSRFQCSGSIWPASGSREQIYRKNRRKPAGAEPDERNIVYELAKRNLFQVIVSE